VKVRVHVFGALFGCVCAIAFSLAPFVAGADVGPSKYTAPRPTTITGGSNGGGIKKHMHRGNVSRRDDGCGS
jgi:hypothetical protein